MCSNMNDLLGNNLSVTQISSLLMCVILSVRNTRRMQSSVLCWRVGMHKTHTDLPATPIPIWCYHFPSDFTLASFHKNSQDAAPPDLLPQANFFFFFYVLQWSYWVPCSQSFPHKPCGVFLGDSAVWWFSGRPLSHYSAVVSAVAPPRVWWDGYETQVPAGRGRGRQLGWRSMGPNLGVLSLSPTLGVKIT